MTAARQPDLLVVIAEQVAELTSPIRVDRRREYRDRRSHRKVVAWDQWQFPSLLDQLRAAAAPPLQGLLDVGHGPQDSRPAANVAAVDALGDITAGVAVWRYVLSLDPRGSLEADMRALVGGAKVLDSAGLAGLAHDVDRWWRRARMHAQFDG
jgi:hypothetical protein